jgi:hypothetical protein
MIGILYMRRRRRIVVRRTGVFDLTVGYLLIPLPSPASHRRFVSYRIN